MRADLHLHTTASDGRLSPAEIVRIAGMKGLDVIAITDHDTTDGVLPALKAAEAYPSLMVIPGIEISTDVPDGEVHILGYFIDCQDQELQEVLLRLKNSRLERAQAMVSKLSELGIHIDWGRVQEFVQGDSVGRPHIAEAMLEKGYITSIREAFTKYIGYDGPAYVKRERIIPAEAVALVARVGGVPVLAHPRDIDDLDGFIDGLKGAGLMGLEVYYGGYLPREVERLEDVARRHGLIPSGGSDYHGLSDDETPIGGVLVPQDSIERLISLAGPREDVIL